MTFQKQAGATVMTFHSCCYQEFLLSEIWGALTIGTKYKSGCVHSDKTSQFKPVELTPEEIKETIARAQKEWMDQRSLDDRGAVYLVKKGKAEQD